MLMQRPLAHSLKSSHSLMSVQEEETHTLSLNVENESFTHEALEMLTSAAFAV